MEAEKLMKNDDIFSVRVQKMDNFKQDLHGVHIVNAIDVIIQLI